jgi:hypothetical protein
MSNELLDLEFKYICRYQFGDLIGTDPVVRHCNECNLDVINLDALTFSAAKEVIASSARQRVCVSATVLHTRGRSCVDSNPEINNSDANRRTYQYAGQTIERSISFVGFIHPAYDIKETKNSSDK